MNRKVFFKLIFIFLPIIWILPINADGNPTMKVGNRMYDFGQIFQKQRMPFHFLITNSGTTPLIIYDAEVGCDCTYIDVFKNQVQPDESITIRGILDTSFISRDIERIIVLSTNDPEKRKYQLFLKAYIIDTVDFYPSVLQFSDISFNAGLIMRQVSLYHRNSEKFRIKKIKTEVDYITITPVTENEVENIVDIYVDLSKIPKNNFSFFATTIEFILDTETGEAKEYYDILFYNDKQDGKPGVNKSPA